MSSITAGRFLLTALVLTGGLIQGASAEFGASAPFGALTDPPLADSSDPSSPAESPTAEADLLHEDVALASFTTAASFGATCNTCAPTGACQTGSDCDPCDPSLRFCDWWKVKPDRRIALGLNGSAGVTETLDLVSGYDLKRVWGLHSTVTDVDYFYSRANAATTKNRLYSLTRYERAIAGTPYSWFVDGWVEYDQFKDFDIRLAFHSGLIRTCLKTERQLFRLLAGIGAARAFGGVVDEWQAEPEFGSLYELKINKRQKLYVMSLYYPELDDPSLFRLNIKAGWEVKISDERDLSFLISAFNRYDNTDPTAPKPNTVDYTLSFVLGF